MRCTWLAYAAVALFTASSAPADPARVEAAEAELRGDGWRVSVTLSHGDTGWEDYANGWRIEDADGTLLAERPLLHPHVHEQPFTRSLSGVVIPRGIERVYVRASTNADGWGAALFPLELPR